MTLYRVINYESFKVHHATAGREDLAKMWPAEDVTAENWHHWRTLCGVDLIGHVYTHHEVDCAKCIKAYDAAQKKAAELMRIFG